MGASRYLDLVNEKVVVYDGAFGTYVQTLGLGPDDFGGDHFEGCNELLVVTRPDVIATMHDEFFKVGVDVVETATFGAFAVPLAEYGIAERSHEINLAAARIAREVADGHGGLVAGSIGPGHEVRLPRPDPLRRAPRRVRGAGRPASSRAGSTCSSSRPSSTCSARRPG